MAMPTLTHDPAQAFTYADLDNIPDDGHRWEVIGGSLVVSPAPFFAHQLAVRELTAILREAETPDTLVIPAPYDWRVEATGESFQPDVTVVRRVDVEPHGPLTATPLLVVEVVSPGREDQDRTIKRARYEALGVPGYWIVDPAGPALTELRRSAQGRYVEWATAHGDETFTTAEPFPAELTPTALTWTG